ncbi:MAG: exodeoxyribonuclease VII small subunit [Bacillota bacterium]
MGKEELSFEDAVTQLEEIVDNLEDKEISLDEALQKYEQGVKLSKFCSNKLQQAEEKIKIIRSEAGTVEVENYEEEGK